MSTVLWPNGKTTPPPFSWEGHFGPRNPDLPFASRYHLGQDFYGFSDVHAIADGTVVSVGWRDGWYGGGYMVWIQHDGFFSRSLHLRDGSALVSTGQKVTAGQLIATVGNTPGRGMADHLHLEITLGNWHAGNHGQIDPRPFLEARVGRSGSASGGGGGPSTTINPSEEDDMRLIRVTDGAQKGRHFAIAPEYIREIVSKESVKAFEDAFGVKEVPVKTWSFERIRRIYGIPDGVIGANGDIRDDLTGGTKYVSGGTWSRAQRAERYAWVAQKG